MNVERAIAEVGRQRKDQPVGILFNGKVYPILPCLDEVNIDGVTYAVLVADVNSCVGTPNEDDDSSSIFATPKVLAFQNSERALSDARNGHAVVLDDNLDYQPGTRCIAVLSFDDDFDGDECFVVHVYTQTDGRADIRYNDTGFVEHETYTYSKADDLDGCADLFHFCGLTPVRG